MGDPPHQKSTSSNRFDHHANSTKQANKGSESVSTPLAMDSSLRDEGISSLGSSNRSNSSTLYMA